MGRIAGHKEGCPCPACKDPKDRISLRLDAILNNKLDKVSLEAGKTKTEVIGTVLQDFVNKTDKGECVS